MRLADSTEPRSWVGVGWEQCFFLSGHSCMGLVGRKGISWKTWLAKPNSLMSTVLETDVHFSVHLCWFCRCRVKSGNPVSWTGMRRGAGRMVGVEEHRKKRKGNRLDMANNWLSVDCCHLYYGWKHTRSCACTHTHVLLFLLPPPQVSSICLLGLQRRALLTSLPFFTSLYISTLAVSSFLSFLILHFAYSDFWPKKSWGSIEKPLECNLKWSV